MIETKKRLAIIGTKTFAEQLTDIAVQTGKYVVVGYYDNVEPAGNVVYGRPVLGKVDDAICDYKKNKFDCIFIGVGYTRFDLREHFYDQVKGVIPMANLIMPSCQIDESAILGEGIYVGPLSRISPHAVIDDNVFIHGGCSVGHNTHIHSHCYLSGSDYIAGFCEIGVKTFVGLGVCIADHVTVCGDVWIGIGCVVANDIRLPGKYVTPSMRLVKMG